MTPPRESWRCPTCGHGVDLWVRALAAPYCPHNGTPRHAAPGSRMMLVGPLHLQQPDSDNPQHPAATLDPSAQKGGGRLRLTARPPESEHGGLHSMNDLPGHDTPHVNQRPNRGR